MNYEPLNRNRLIALLGVIYAKSSPGCTIVTDSTTSEGLGKFLEGNLGLHHFRYLRGYANVIRKAKEITESGVANAEVAIETSGHCAMNLSLVYKSIANLLRHIEHSMSLFFSASKAITSSVQDD